MAITYRNKGHESHPIRGAPSNAVLDDILIPFFEKCGYTEQDHFEVMIWESGRLGELGRIGIKLTHFHDFAARVVLCYGKNAVGLRIGLKAANGKNNIPGKDLFEQLKQRNGGRVFILEEYERSKKAAARAGQSVVDPDLVFEEPAPQGAEVIVPEVRVGAEAGGHAPPASDAGEAHPEEGNLLVPENLHKGTKALVIMYGNDLSTKFDIESFREILVQGGVPVGPKTLGISLMKTFLRQELVVRANDASQKPALYSLTATALAYARSIDSKWTYKKGPRKPAVVDGAVVPVVPVVPKSVEADFASLRELIKIDTQYRSLLNQVSDAEAELARLEGAGGCQVLTEQLESKERQPRELQAAVDLLRLQVQGHQQVIATTKARVVDLKAQVNNPALVEKIKLLADLRAMLAPPA